MNPKTDELLDRIFESLGEITEAAEELGEAVAELGYPTLDRYSERYVGALRLTRSHFMVFKRLLKEVLDDAGK